MIAVTRALTKFLIAVPPTREFKHDERVMDWGGVRSQTWLTCHVPTGARVHCKLLLWISHYLLCHFLQIVLSVPLFIPYVDRRLHSTSQSLTLPRCLHR